MTNPALRDRIDALDKAILETHDCYYKPVALEAQDIIRAQAALLGQLGDSISPVRNEIFYFMTRNVDEKGTGSYKLLGAIKEDLTDFIKALKDAGI